MLIAEPQRLKHVGEDYYDGQKRTPMNVLSRVSWIVHVLGCLANTE